MRTELALGSLYESLGDHAAADTLYHKALAANENHAGPYNPAFAAAVKGLHRLPPSDEAAGKVHTPANANISSLTEESGLESSRKLEKIINSAKNNDLLNENDDTDRALVSDFRKHILQSSEVKFDASRRDSSKEAVSNLLLGM